MHPHFTGLEGIISYFRFMDLEDHVLGDFKQVAHNVIKCLQRKPCVPYTSTPVDDEKDDGAKKGETKDEETKDEVVWSLPSTCVVSQLILVPLEFLKLKHSLNSFLNSFERQISQIVFTLCEYHHHVTFFFFIRLAQTKVVKLYLPPCFKKLLV